MSIRIDAATLRHWLEDGNELALIDVREAGLFGEGHLLLAVNLPYSRLERDVTARVPRKTTRLVVVGDANADRAARVLAGSGYTDVSVLEGGVTAWSAAGERLHPGVNVPSKAFAEYVEHHYHTPDIAAEELAALQAAKADLVLLDSRTVEEHQRFHVPGAVSCPGSELVHRFADLVPSPDTLVVVTCAGRTRGVMGAQTLRNLGVPNRVLALRGGTQGWRLAGFALEREGGPVADAPSESARSAGIVRAQTLRERFAVPAIDAGTLAAWRADATRTTYLFDVRPHDEYVAGHVAGAVWAQGVQLIQCVDHWAATRGARVVLSDDDGARASVAAHWLRQLGWDAHVLTQAGLDANQAAGDTEPESPAFAPWVDTAGALNAIADGAIIVQTGASAAFRAGHPPTARWVNRSAVPDAVRTASAVVILADDDDVAQLLARELGPSRASVLRGGIATWRTAGLPLEATPDEPSDANRIDHLFWLHDRHEGNLEASAAYLAWEAALPATIGDPRRAGLALSPIGEAP